MVDLKECETCYHHHHVKYTEWFCDYFNKCENNNKYKPYTRGDMIRQMDDEELAVFLCEWCNSECPVYKKYCIEGSTEAMGNWLKESVKFDY